MESAKKKNTRCYPLKHNPCKDCTRRKILCHSTCKEHHDWLAEMDEYHRWKDKERMLDSYRKELSQRLYLIRKSKGLED